MTSNQIEEMSQSMCGYLIKLGRAPTAREIEIYIKNWITAKQRGKLMSAD